MNKRVFFLILFLLVFFACSINWAQSADQPVQDPNTPSAQEKKPAVPQPEVTEKPLPAQLENLLDRIEKVGAELKSFQADLLFRQEQILLDTVTIRNGKIYYQTDSKSVYARIHFDDFLQKELDDPHPPKPVKFDEDITFDGLWLVLRNARTKTIQSWEVSKERRNLEAFRLGKGPFPLPFAIRKKDVIEHFEVSLVKPAANDPEDTQHLKLKPRKTSPYAEEYIRMDLWISNQTTLPLQISYEKDDYEITTVTWIKPLTDKNIDPDIFQLKPPGTDWTVERHPLEDASEDSPK